MIKVGDKVICIKTDYISTEGNLCELDMTIGELYTIDRISNRSITIDRWSFGLIDEIFIRKFQDYFITLADWREKQIDNILND
jgi:hypothetical protein